MQLVSAGFLCLFAAAAMTLLINQQVINAKAAVAPAAKPIAAYPVRPGSAG